MSPELGPMEPIDLGLADAPTSRVPLTSSAFTDRVMTTIAAVPAPSPTRSFFLALRQGTMRSAATSLAVASHLVTVRTAAVAPRVRARSFALVLGVAFVLGTGSVAGAAAVREIVPLYLPGLSVIDHDGSGGDPMPVRRRPAAPPPSIGPRLVEAPGTTAGPPASATPHAGPSHPHATAGHADASTGGGGSRGKTVAAGSAHGDDSDHGGSDGDASDGSDRHDDANDNDLGGPGDEHATDDGGDHDGGDSGR